MTVPCSQQQAQEKGQTHTRVLRIVYHKKPRVSSVRIRKGKSMTSYIQFPKKLLTCSYISAQAKILYCVLYDLKRAQKAGYKKEYGLEAPTPSTEGVEVKQKTLAIKMGLSLSQIKRVLQELKTEGLISSERWGNDVTRYYIVEPDSIKTDVERELEKKLAKG